MLSPDQKQRLTVAAASAVACERLCGIPAELTVAQWALESTWGVHQPGNNCFGIKAYPGCHGTQLLQSTEVCNGIRTPVVEAFATFASLDDCFAKHASLFIRDKPYAPAWTAYRASHDLGAFVVQIARIYATDPNYSRILLEIMAMPDVKSALTDARAAPAPQLLSS